MPGDPTADAARRPNRRGRLVTLVALLVVTVAVVSGALIRKKRHDDRQRLLRTPVTLLLPPRPLPAGEPVLRLPPLEEGGAPSEVLDEPGVRALLLAGQTDRLDAFGERLWGELEKSGSADELVDDFTGAFGVPDPRLARPLDAWVEHRPASAVAHLARASFWMSVGAELRGSQFVNETEAGRLDELEEALARARPDAVRAAELAPRASAPHVLLLKLARYDADTSAVHRELKAAIAGCPSCLTVRVHGMRALAPRWGGSEAEMRALADESPVSLNPRFAALPGFLDADAASLERNPADGLKRLDQALAKGEHWSFFEMKAAMLIRFKKHDEALLAVEHALTLRPNVAELAAMRAEELAMLGRWDEAPKAALRLLELSPAGEPGREHVEFVARQAVIDAYEAEQHGQLERALQLLDVSAGLRPGVKDTIMRRNTLIFRGEQPTPGTLQRLRDELKAAPDDLRRRQRLDWVLSLISKYDEILPLWNEHLARHPDDPRALFERSGCRFHLDDVDGARADAMRACELGLLEACGQAARLGASW